MKKIFYYIVFFLSVIGCGKDKKQEVPNPNISLINKTEQEIRALMIGRWNSLYSISPHYGGRDTTYSLPNTYLNISADDTLTEFGNSILYAKTKFRYERIPGNDGRWKMTSIDGAYPSLAYTLDSLRTDTLITHYEWTGHKIIYKKQ